MATRYTLKNLSGADAAEIQETLERGEVVYFERCPIGLPSEDDLEFLRGGFGAGLKTKNLSYHPESDSVPRFEGSPEIKARVERLLRIHGQRVAEFWERTIPAYVTGWQLGTTSFRPVEERGRGLKPRLSNELVHIDAGAYGATNGARILRFFVNVHPTRPRIWGTKGSFASLMQRHDALWQAARGGRDRVPLEKRGLDRAYSGIVRAAGTVYPLLRVIDSSPYDRSMRRIHNYMKESRSFREDNTDYREIHFPPTSAWMVFTDGISHSVLAGQHAFVTTALVPLANCLDFARTPYGILAAAN